MALLTAAKRDELVTTVTGKRDAAIRKAEDFDKRAKLWKAKAVDLQNEIDNLKAAKVKTDTTES